MFTIIRKIFCYKTICDRCQAGHRRTTVCKYPIYKHLVITITIGPMTVLNCEKYNAQKPPYIAHD